MPALMGDDEGEKPSAIGEAGGGDACSRSWWLQTSPAARGTSSLRAQRPCRRARRTTKLKRQRLASALSSRCRRPRRMGAMKTHRRLPRAPYPGIAYVAAHGDGRSAEEVARARARHVHGVDAQRERGSLPAAQPRPPPRRHHNATATRGPGLPVDSEQPVAALAGSSRRRRRRRPTARRPSGGRRASRACPRCAQLQEPSSATSKLPRSPAIRSSSFGPRLPRGAGLKMPPATRQTLAEITKNVDADAVEPRRQAADGAVDDCGLGLAGCLCAF